MEPPLGKPLAAAEHARRSKLLQLQPVLRAMLGILPPRMRGHITVGRSANKTTRVILNGLTAFVGILLLRFFEYGIFEAVLERSDLAMTIGSQGAAAVLVFNALKSPLACTPCRPKKCVSATHISLHSVPM
jgi:hypothetical protein